MSVCLGSCFFPLLFKMMSHGFLFTCFNKCTCHIFSSVWCHGETEQFTQAVLCSLKALQPNACHAHHFSHMPKVRTYGPFFGVNHPCFGVFLSIF